MPVRRSVCCWLIIAILIAPLFSPAHSHGQARASAARLDVPFLSQTALRGETDEQGKPLYLGKSKSVLLWEKGCGVASLAMVYQKYGVDTDVIRLNQTLRQNGGFSGALLYWSKTEAFRKAGEPWIQGIERVNTARPSTYRDRVDAELAAGHPVIAYLGARHYVVLVGKDDQGGYLINDPWELTAEEGQGIPLEKNAVGLGFDHITQFVFVYPDRNAPTNSIAVSGAIADKYFSVGGSRSGLGNPAAAEDPLPGDNARWQPFEGGAIFALPSGTYAIYGPVWDKFLAEGAVAGMGWPLDDVYSYPYGATVAWQGDFGQGCIIAHEGDPPEQARVYRSGETFRAELFANSDLQGSAAYVRLDPELLFNWQEGAPGPWVEPDGFSVRWSGTLHVRAPFGWWYNFLISADDGVRVKIDGRLVLDAWDGGQGGRFTQRLGRGDHWLQVEYRHREGLAHLMAAWSPWPTRPVFAAGETAGPMEQLPASAPIPALGPIQPTPAVTPTAMLATATPASTSEFPKLHPEWTSYTNGNEVNDLLVQRDTLWAATNGGVVRWDTRTGKYVKLTTEYGLADNHVNAVASGPDGALWFATASGATRLGSDGSCRTWAKADGLPETRVTAVAVAPDGTVWFGTPKGIAYLGKDERIRSMAHTAGLSASSVSDIAIATDGAVWFATEGDGVGRLDSHGNWTVLTSIDGLVSDIVHSVAVADDGTVWLASGEGNRGIGGANRLTSDGRLETFTVQSGLACWMVNAVAIDGNRAVWFATCGGVSRLTVDGRWQNYETTDGSGAALFHAAATGADGSVWFGSRLGIRGRRADGGWQTLTTGDVLPQNSVVAIEVAANGTVWLGTDVLGAARLDVDGNGRAFGRQDGLADSMVRAVEPAPDGAVWFGTSDGASRLGIDGRWQTVTPVEGLLGDRVQDILAAPDKSLWFATGAGVCWLRPDGHSTILTEADGLADNDVLAIALAADGSLWFGTADGASHLTVDGRWQDLGPQDGLPGTYVQAMAVGPDGSVWFGTRGGLARLGPDGHLETIGVQDFSAYVSVRSMCVASDGALWFGTLGGGAARLEMDGDWLTYTSHDGLAGNEVYDIAVAPDRAVWFATGGGVSRYQPQP